jgi:Flp pilus assembly protein TadG
MVILVAFTLPLIVMMAAFALDVAWMQLVRSELRTATDASSRAGAKTLSLGQSVPLARAAAKDAASRNQVAGRGLQVRDNEIEFGRGTQSNDTARFTFLAGGDLLNAVRVTGNRTAASVDGPVNLFLGSVMGVSTFEPSMVATTTQLDRDICLVVDRSGSMMQEIIGTNVPGPICGPPHPTRSRWGALATAVAGFLNELERTAQREQCALVSYSSAGIECGNRFTTSDINADLSLSYDQIAAEMERLSSGPVKGFTSISAGIDDGIRVLSGPRVRPFAVKSIVLLTDGRHNRGR